MKPQTPESFRKLLLAYLKRNKLSTRGASKALGGLASHAAIAYWASGNRDATLIYRKALTPLISPTKDF